MSITTEAMVVNLQIGAWAGLRFDKEASRAVTEANAAASDAARVNKHLIAKETLKPIIAASGALRTHFYNVTLPWKDNGDRLLTRKMFTTFMADHSRLVDEFNNAVEDFVFRTYPAERARSEFRMGALFKADDYPAPEQLRRRYYVNLDIDAVTEAGDFRVVMDQNSLTEVQDTMTKAMEARLGRAMQDIWSRLTDTLSHFSERMAGDGVFRNTTVTHLTELLDMLPALNILNDPELERIRVEVLQALNGVDVKDLRADPAIRKVVAAETQDILDTMAGFMNAFKEAA